MDTSKALRALSNETRANILEWLKDPHQYFDDQPVGSFDDEGVCVTLIQQKANLGQSTTSQYLTQLFEAGLVTVRRVGQWTYYKRDENAIRQFLDELKQKL